MDFFLKSQVINHSSQPYEETFRWGLLLDEDGPEGWNAVKHGTKKAP